MCVKQQKKKKVGKKQTKTNGIKTLNTITITIRDR